MFTNIPGPGIRTAHFAALGAWSGALPKNTENLRDSDAFMRVAVPRRRGPAGLRDLFRFCRNCGLYALRSGPFRVCEARGGITTLSALYVLLKRRTAACQSGSFAIFRGQVGVVSRTIPIFLRIHRIFCWQFQLQTLLRYGTISSTNWNFQISLCKQPLNLHHQLQFPDGC